MADMIDAESLQALQAKHPNAVTLCYVNTSADVKAHCDYCCTSSNALKMVQHILKSMRRLFLFLINIWLNTFQRRSVINLLPGKVFVQHMLDSCRKIFSQAKKLHPQAKVLAHPECKPEITSLPMWWPLRKKCAAMSKILRKQNLLSARKSA